MSAPPGTGGPAAGGEAGYLVRQAEAADLGAIAAFEVEIARVSFGDEAITDVELHRRRVAGALVAVPNERSPRSGRLDRPRRGRALAALGEPALDHLRIARDAETENPEYQPCECVAGGGRRGRQPFLVAHGRLHDAEQVEDAMDCTTCANC